MYTERLIIIIDTMDKKDIVIGGNPRPAIIVARAAIHDTENIISFRDLNKIIEDSRNPCFSIFNHLHIDINQYNVY